MDSLQQAILVFQPTYNFFVADNRRSDVWRILLGDLDRIIDLSSQLASTQVHTSPDDAVASAAVQALARGLTEAVGLIYKYERQRGGMEKLRNASVLYQHVQRLWWLLEGDNWSDSPVFRKGVYYYYFAEAERDDWYRARSKLGIVGVRQNMHPQAMLETIPAVSDVEARRILHWEEFLAAIQVNV